MIRWVADSRKISVHEILSPAPRITLVYNERFGCVTPTYEFDPYDGWSWRSVLVWSTDAARAQRERNDVESQAAWQHDGLSAHGAE